MNKNIDKIIGNTAATPMRIPDGVVDKTTEQTIYAKKTFMSPITAYDSIEVGKDIEFVNDAQNRVKIGMDTQSGVLKITSPATDKVKINDKRVLIDTDKIEIDTRLASTEGELGAKASAGAVFELETKKADKDTTEWQLIESVTLEQDVKQLHCDLKGGQYKELYIRFAIPTLNPDKLSDFPKGRVQVFEKGYTCLFDEGAAFYTDSGTDWFLTCQLTMIGNNCVAERKIYTNTYPYAIGYNNNRWSHTFGTPLENNFMRELWFNMLPSDTWTFPQGTTYELWGVKA